MITDSRQISANILTDVFLRSKNLKHEFYLKTKNIPSKKDIKFIKALVYGVARLKKTIDDQISSYYQGNYKKLEENFKNYLRIGIYQISMMDKVPNYASVNSTVEASKSANYKFSKTVNAILIRHIKEKNKISLKNYDYNYNKAILKDWRKIYSEAQVKRLCEWNDLIPSVWFYADIKIIQEIKRYKKFNFSYHSNFKDYIVFDDIKEAIDELVQKEITYIQSPSSGLVVKLLNITPGDSVLDACAAPGAKSKQIYQFLNGRGALNINDVNSRKYKKLMLDFKDYDVKISSKDASTDKFQSYDKILLDVPCSSTGTIQKNPDIRWKKIDYKKLEKTQFSILENMSSYVKKDGVILYSTCSLNENENWKIIERFLTLNKDFYLDNASNYIDSNYVEKNGCMSIFPPLHQTEGMFAARLIKK